MHGNIGLHELYALVSPQAFSDRMDQHWTNKLSLCPSQALRDLWRVMGTTFQDAITDTAKGLVMPWRVLQPPTGSGKTQGACVYSALQAEMNHTSPHKHPVGILIVTRLIEQADDLVTTINALAGRTVAVANHSASRAAPQQLHESDVLVITHQAYVNASHSLSGQRNATWDRLTLWRGGTRLLTIIDEALANAIEASKVTTSSLAQVIGYIPVEVRKAYPQQVAALERLNGVLVALVDAQGQQDNAACMLWQEHTAPTDLAQLREAMWAQPYDVAVLDKDSPEDRSRLARRVDDVLKDAEAILDQFAYYAQKGREHTINSAALMVPLGTPGPVVLDATASQNFLWDLFEDRAKITPVPPGVRDYSRVVLHVARTASGLGKASMIKHANERFPRLLHALESELAPERSLFLCVHKAVEHVALSYKTHFTKFDVGHWGAVDGRNEWAGHDTAVIFGLPYRDQIWANNTFFALQGAQDDAWLRAPKWNEHSDVRKVMAQRQLSVSIIQAINRICCRKVIDARGRSPSADIYIVLPTSTLGDAILQDILADMPGLVVKDWPFAVDGPKVRRARKGTSHEALLSLMNHKLPGETPVSAIQRALSLKPNALKKLREVLSDGDHRTTVALREMGVEYVVRGAGRGAKSFLVKRARN